MEFFFRKQSKDITGTLYPTCKDCGIASPSKPCRNQFHFKTSWNPRDVVQPCLQELERCISSEEPIHTAPVGDPSSVLSTYVGGS